MSTSYSWERMNLYNSFVSPSTIHCSDVALTEYFKRYLVQKAFSVFKFTWPENWAGNYCEYALAVGGNLTVFNTDLWGYMGLWGSPYGFNVQYQPTHMCIANPLLQQAYTLEIGRECEVLRYQPDYGGIMDKVEFYAQLMSLVAQGIAVNISNAKLGMAFLSENKNQAETWKKAYDKLSAGNPIVCVDYNQLYNTTTHNPRWEFVNRDVNKNYMAPQMLEDLRKIENMFATDFGLPNANTEKKERMLVDEVNSNNTETKAIVDTWYERLKDSIDRTKRLFQGIRLGIEWRFKDDTGEFSGYNGNVPLQARPI